MTGYLGSSSQAAPIAALVRALKALNPDAIYLCDPVIGDASGLYVPETTAAAIRGGGAARWKLMVSGIYVK
mgnify:CR=1 FL=1